MADDTTTETPEQQPETGGQSADNSPEGSQNAPKQPEGSEIGDGDVESLRKALSKANKDAERHRRQAGEKAEQAAKSARDEIAAQIAAALGIAKPDEVDPAALADKLTAETASKRSAQMELAVWRAAGGAEANAEALLDSRAFMRSVESLDPTDSDAVLAAITAAVNVNQSLRTVPTRRVPGPNPAIGNGGAPPTREQAIAAAIADGNPRLAEQLKADQLLSLANNNQRNT